MAKKSAIAADARRRRTVARYAEERSRLLAVLSHPSSTPQEKRDARRALDRQPRDASATRVRNRDAVDGRPRGHLRAFGLSRVRFREMAHDGLLPGIRKSSW